MPVRRHHQPAPDPPRRHRLELLRLVGDLADRHRLVVECAECRHRALIDAHWLRGRRPAGEKLAALAHRLRCTGCGRLGGAWWSVIDPASG